MILWSLSPVNLRTMGFGNLNNVFAQAVFVLFIAGAQVLRRGSLRFAVLTLLVALSATAHLSSFIVLLTLLVMSLLLRQRSSAAFKPLLVGVLLAGTYYATFLPLVLKQLPRLLTEHGGSGGVFDPLRLPTLIVRGLGWPLLLLVTLSFLTSRVRDLLPLSRSVGITAALLAVAALVSPIEVRYLLAVVPVLSLTAASLFGQPSRSATGFPEPELSSVIDLRFLRVLSSELVLAPLAGVLLIAAIIHGFRVLFEILPLSGA